MQSHVKRALIGLIAFAVMWASHAYATIDPIHEQYTFWECGLIQVTPPDHDRNPGVKIVLSTDPDPSTFFVTHTMASGATYERTDQYRLMRIWNASSTFNWTGQSFKDSKKTIIGTFGPDQRTGRLQYIERIYRNNRLETTIVSSCFIADNVVE